MQMYPEFALPLLSTGFTDAKLFAIGLGSGVLVGAVLALFLVIMKGD